MCVQNHLPPDGDIDDENDNGEDLEDVAPGVDDDNANVRRRAYAAGNVEDRETRTLTA